MLDSSIHTHSHKLGSEDRVYYLARVTQSCFARTIFVGSACRLKNEPSFEYETTFFISR